MTRAKEKYNSGFEWQRSDGLSFRNPHRNEKKYFIISNRKWKKKWNSLFFKFEASISQKTESTLPKLSIKKKFSELSAAADTRAFRKFALQVCHLVLFLFLSQKLAVLWWEWAISGHIKRLRESAFMPRVERKITISHFLILFQKKRGRRRNRTFSKSYRSQTHRNNNFPQ